MIWSPFHISTAIGIPVTFTRDDRLKKAVLKSFWQTLAPDSLVSQRHHRHDSMPIFIWSFWIDSRCNSRFWVRFKFQIKYNIGYISALCVALKTNGTFSFSYLWQTKVLHTSLERSILIQVDSSNSCWTQGCQFLQVRITCLWPIVWVDSKITSSNGNWTKMRKKYNLELETIPSIFSQDTIMQLVSYVNVRFIFWQQYSIKNDNAFISVTGFF